MSAQAAYYSNDRLVPVMDGMALKEQVFMQPNLQIPKGQAMGLVTSASASEVQTLTVTGTPTGGTFTLIFNGKETAPIAYNANAAAVQAALVALSNIGTGNVTCGGGALPGTPVTITFAGELANLPQNLILRGQNNLTGGTTPDAAVAETTPGVAQYRYGKYDDAASDGRQVCVGFTEFPVRTDERGRVVLGSELIGEHGNYERMASLFLGGYFKNAELTGLDANGLTDLKGRVIGGALGGANTKVLVPF